MNPQNPYAVWRRGIPATLNWQKNTPLRYHFRDVRVGGDVLYTLNRIYDCYQPTTTRKRQRLRIVRTEWLVGRYTIRDPALTLTKEDYALLRYHARWQPGAIDKFFPELDSGDVFYLYENVYNWLLNPTPGCPSQYPGPLTHLVRAYGMAYGRGDRDLRHRIYAYLHAQGFQSPHVKYDPEFDNFKYWKRKDIKLHPTYHDALRNMRGRDGEMAIRAVTRLLANARLSRTLGVVPRVPRNVFSRPPPPPDPRYYTPGLDD